jgi:flagellar biosynthetic protein FliQ
MNEADALDLLHASIWTILVGTGPAVAAAMLVGVLIALFQALTQIQEATLTFVPKIIAVLAALALSGSLIGAQIHTFTEQVYGRVEKGY